MARSRAVDEARFARTAADGAFVPSARVTEEPDEPGVWDLIQQARDLALWVEQHREDQRRWRESFGVEQDDVTVGTMMDYLRDKLATTNGRLDGVGLLDSQATASRRSCLFLGMLEMARDQQVELH